jgi:acyl dehydratase
VSQTNMQDGPTVGQVLKEKSFDVTQARIDDYFEGLEIDGGPFDRGEQPVPSMIAIEADSYFAESAFAQQRGHLWMRQQWRFVEPLRRGESYSTRARIADIYKRRDRTLVNTEVQVVDHNGAEALTLNHHQSFLLDAPVDQVQFREPGKKEGVRKFVVPEGDPVPGFDRVITLEMCGQYFHGNKSYHTDLAASKELGFREVVVGGAMTMSYIGHLLDGYFGERGFRGGELEVKFTNPTWPNDHINVKGVSTGPAASDPSRESVFAWIEKDDGTIVMIANASAPS